MQKASSGESTTQVPGRYLKLLVPLFVAMGGYYSATISYLEEPNPDRQVKPHKATCSFLDNSNPRRACTRARTSPWREELPTNLAALRLVSNRDRKMSKGFARKTKEFVLSPPCSLCPLLFVPQNTLQKFFYFSPTNSTVAYWITHSKKSSIYLLCLSKQRYWINIGPDKKTSSSMSSWNSVL